MRGMLLLGLLLTAGASSGGDAKTDLANLQGKWLAKVSNPKIASKAELTFSQNTFALILWIGDRQEFSMKGTFTINATKNPKELDMKAMNKTDKEEKEEVVLAIYELKGDTLRWCGNEPGRERLKKFPADEGGASYLNLTFQRAK